MSSILISEFLSVLQKSRNQNHFDFYGIYIIFYTIYPNSKQETYSFISFGSEYKLKTFSAIF